MKPTLFTIYHVRVQSFSFFLALSFIFGLFICITLARKYRHDELKIVGLGLLTVISGLIGAKLAAGLLFWETFFVFRTLPLFFGTSAWLKGGLHLLGGMLFCLGPVWFYCRLNRLPFLAIIDILLHALSGGLILGYTGCLLGGNCPGKIWQLPEFLAGLKPFLPAESLDGSGFSRYPIQLVLLLAAIGLHIWLRWNFDAWYQKKPGLASQSFITLFAAVQFLAEFFRSDPRAFLGPFSDTQVLALFWLTYQAISAGQEYRQRRQQFFDLPDSTGLNEPKSPNSRATR
jgi:phosphatidylglycerol:prolipoprotein diacylglycerol transferase